MDYRRILCFISVWTCFAIVSSATLFSISTDEAALHALRAQINSSSDPRNLISTNWSMSTSVCDWIGVTCIQNRVTALNISNMSLGGIIPPQLGNLSSLVYLDMSYNGFHGNLPHEMARLTQLKVMNLTHNSFDGEIPSLFGSLTQLEYLWLGNNSFGGSIPSTLSNLTNLEYLRLPFNNLDGEIPEELGNLRNLQYLILSYNVLVGSIPDSIFNITSLRSFTLWNNQLTGGIPANVGRLVNLEDLNLGSNKLTGPIPPSIFNLSSVREFWLYRNELTGVLPSDLCQRLPTVQILLLSDNPITGKIPASIGNCSSLVQLNLGNHMSGGIPEEISRLRNLEWLNLDWNHLGGHIPSSIFNMSRLSTLTLMENNLSGTLPSTVGLNLPNLKYFSVDTNGLSGAIPSSISNASKLSTLALARNMFSGSFPSWIGSLIHLESLYLESNNLTIEPSSVDFFTSLSNCRNLKTVWLGSNPLNTRFPSSIANLSSSLSTLGVSGAGIIGPIPDLRNLSGLSKLVLSYNDLTGSIPLTWGDNLEELYLGENRISGSIPVSLCQVKKLGNLDLELNEMFGQLPNCLGNLTSLRELHLRSNKFTSPIPLSLLKNADLLKLDLSSNLFTNSIPIEIGNLKHVRALDLSHNQFSGDLHSSISDLESLEVLSLADNILQGHIPDSFSNLMSLVTLDLSRNQFNGIIPKSLERLRDLKIFNVSFNRLAGEIPSGGPFQHFNRTSFLSNEGLCGSPLFEVPPCKSNSHNKSSKKKLLFTVCILVGIASTVLTILVLWWAMKLRKVKDATEPSLLLGERQNAHISYSELYQATDGFHQSNLLGTGSFGSVYKVFLEGTTYAIKVFNLQFEGGIRSFVRECEILRNLRHRNLIKVFTSCSNFDFKALILEYMENGSLEKWLHFPNYFLDFLQRIEIMIDVGCALEYLHQGYSTPITHCDLKPQNILLDADMVAHVSDFGISRLLDGEQSIVQTKTLATFGYMAPEYGSEGRVSTKCDIYSYGIILMETFTKKKPTDDIFSGDLSLKSWVNKCFPDNVINIIDDNLIEPDDCYLKEKVQCVKAVMELAISCAAESPSERKEMKDVVTALQRIKAQFLSICNLTSIKK